jgi:hypothetical protein
MTLQNRFILKPNNLATHPSQTAHTTTQHPNPYSVAVAEGTTCASAKWSSIFRR